jgi:NTE family protein
MMFHAGCLRRLNDAGLLRKLSRVSSVSGGSIIVGVLDSAKDKSFPRFVINATNVPY